jgi:hypothetical protein
VIAALAFATVVYATAVDREPQPSRGVANRWQDSGVVEVWRGASMAERSVWACIRRHESLMAGHWTAANPRSTASGAGQWLDSTWRGVAHWVTWRGQYVARGYSRAKYAPPWVQDLTFRHVYARHGLSMWHGTGCVGT